MEKNLPPPIAAYVEANARLDADGMLAAFALEAVVLDDGGRHEGRAELGAWIRTAILANRAVFSPEAWREEDGRIVVEGPTAGDFRGSPIRVAFRFRLEDGAIAALEIA
ncbi:nuclear transport factor 2 family protein [Arenibaculum pallidiluteum]|uniref:nuclear transport factor 2 family protein n=1 Tax=Arenibaculum pallidiluteum TaxID=2812559 RepID=UPI001A969F02|nr:nuclear transport factor 2 family protein [Arenibaculum pallidiluteum]